MRNTWQYLSQLRTSYQNIANIKNNYEQPSYHQDKLSKTQQKLRKAHTKIYGSLIFGIPLCWVILIRGLWNESSPFNLALLNFEVTQQGFGMYVKYLMSGFLIIFALSMLFQFSSYIISHINSLDNKKENTVYG